MREQIQLLISQIRAQQWFDAALTAMTIIVELTQTLKARSDTFATTFAAAATAPVYGNLPMEELCSRLEGDVELSTGTWEILLEILRRLLK